MYPKSQKFDKTDLAKYENTWMQLPQQVSLGAQKNFTHFSIRLKERGKTELDNEYFEHLIAKTILYKRAEKLIGDLKYGGYRAQMVTYTIAWLCHHTSQRIDLDTIWKKQTVSPALQDAILAVSVPVHKIITNAPNGRNITEWCKRKECWEAICSEKVTLKAALQQELLDISRSAKKSADKGIEGPDAHDLEVIAAVSKVSAQTWFNLSKWAKETNNLQTWQRGIAFSIGKALSLGYQVSRKQADQGIKIIAEAENLGFK